MATGGGGFTSAFTALFNVAGNAQEKLDAIRQGSLSLGAGAANASRELVQLASILRNVSLSGAGASVQTQELRARMLELASTGQISSQRLNNMVKELVTIGDMSAPSARIQEVTQRLAALSAQLRTTEIAANKAGTRGMNFMEDASDSLALSVRRVSSAMQGFMLGTSLLQGNLTGLAFSLIFLQFSGFLRISLAMAAMTVAGGGIIKFVRAFVSQRKEIALVANSFLVVTGSTQAYELATQRARDIVEDLGLKHGDLKEATDALRQAQLLLRQRGLEATEDTMRVFLNSLLVAQAGTGDWEKSINTANQAMLEYIETGLIPMAGGTVSVEEANRRGANALVALSPGLVTARQVLDAYIKKMEETDQPVARFVTNLKAILEQAGDLDRPLASLTIPMQTALQSIATASEISLQDLALSVGSATLAIETALSNLADKSELEVGVAGRANRAVIAFREEILKLRDEGELNIPNVEALIEKYGALSDVFSDDFIRRMEKIIDTLERVTELDIDFNIGRRFEPAPTAGGPGHVTPELPRPIGPDLPPGFLRPDELGPVPPPGFMGNASSVVVNINNPTVRSEDDIKRISTDTISALRRATKFSNIGLS